MSTETRARCRSLLWGLSLASTFPVAWLFRDRFLADRFPICIFRVATGKPCPLCGLTRALSHAVHWELRPAFEYNPLWPLAALSLALASGLAIWTGLTGRTLGASPAWKRAKNLAIAASLLLFGGFGLIRLLCDLT